MITKKGDKVIYAGPDSNKLGKRYTVFHTSESYLVPVEDESGRMFILSKHHLKPDPYPFMDDEDIRKLKELNGL